VTTDITTILGTRAICSRCGKTVWLRKIAVSGSMSAVPTAKIYGWVTRKGTKPRPLTCTAIPGLTRHTVDGYQVEYFGPAGEGWKP
jgi:hypothetical protein